MKETFWTYMMIALVSIALVGTTLSLYRFITGGRITSDEYRVANRRIGSWLGTIIVAMAWQQAPSLLLSGQYALQGIGQFWAFWIPNVLGIVIAAFYVTSILIKVPFGYTNPQFLGAVYGGNVQRIGFVLQLFSVTGLLALNLAAVSLWLKLLLDIPAEEVAMWCGGFAFIWVFIFGMPSTLVGDLFKITLVGIGLILIGYLWYTYTGTLSPIPIGKAPAFPQGQETFAGWFWISGLALSVTLIGGIPSNPDISEKNFSIVNDGRTLRNSYLGAAVIFGLATLAFGSIGIFASYGIEGIISVFPAFAILKIFATEEVRAAVSVGLVLYLMFSSGSYMLSGGNLLANELYIPLRHWIANSQWLGHWFKKRDPSNTEILWACRTLMFIPIAAATYIATRPGISVPKIFESLAVVRGEIIFPILLAAWWPVYAYSKPIGLGMVTGLVVGIPLMYWGIFFGNDWVFFAHNGKPLAVLVAVLCPPIFWAVYRLFFGDAHQKVLA